jgi:deoxyribodipyrimidine photo-lyase
MMMSREAPVVVWFRRDLRLDDHTALTSASVHGAPIVPLWVWDDRLLVASKQGSARQAFYLQSLASLASDQARLGSPLLVRRGAPKRVVPAVAAELGVRAVHWNEDYTPLARRRDRAVAAALASLGIGAHPHTDLLLHHPGLLFRASGDPQTVYGAFRRAWEALPKPGPVGGPIALAPLASPPAGEPLPCIPAAGNLPEAGEEAARQLLEAFCRGGIDGYAEQRSLPAAEGVSRLSPHLRVGSISPRRVYQAATQARESRPGATAGAVAFLAGVGPAALALAR